MDASRVRFPRYASDVVVFVLHDNSFTVLIYTQRAGLDCLKFTASSQILINGNCINLFSAIFPQASDLKLQRCEHSMV